MHVPEEVLRNLGGIRDPTRGSTQVSQLIGLSECTNGSLRPCHASMGSRVRLIALIAHLEGFCPQCAPALKAKSTLIENHLMFLSRTKLDLREVDLPFLSVTGK
jgi:hypothetical protein